MGSLYELTQNVLPREQFVGVIFDDFQVLEIDVNQGQIRDPEKRGTIGFFEIVQVMFSLLVNNNIHLTPEPKLSLAPRHSAQRH